MKSLLHKLFAYQLPIQLSKALFLELVTIEEFDILLSKGVIFEDGYFTSLLCDLCDSSHEIDKLFEDPQICCVEHARITKIKKEDLVKYRLNFDLLISYFFTDGKNVETIVKDTLWKVTTVKTDKVIMPVYYSHSTLPEAHDHISTIHPYTVVLYLGRNEIHGSTYYLSVSDLLSEKKVNINVIRTFLENTVRFVEFKDGDLYLYNKIVVTVNKDIPQYYFLERLFNDFGKWVTNDELLAYAKKGVAKARGQKNYSSDYGNDFSKQMKQKILTASNNKALLNKIIVSNRKQSYRIINPS